MLNPTTMTPAQKNSYIFEKNQSKEFRGGRFQWISDCLLGDIRTFLDGIKCYLADKGSYPDRGGGNLSVPILLSTALGLVSDLYAGTTEYMKPVTQHNANRNVKQFVSRFFPEHYKKFPLLLWDGVRNGITHLFSPKPLRYEGNVIRFRFFVERKATPAWAEREGDVIWISVNDFELYDVISKAIEDYRQELKENESLQNKFIQAWGSIEEHEVRLDDPNKTDKLTLVKLTEAKTFVSEVEAAKNHLVLWKDRPAKDAVRSLQTKPLSETVQEVLPHSTSNVACSILEREPGQSSVRPPEENPEAR